MIGILERIEQYDRHLDDELQQEMRFPSKRFLFWIVDTAESPLPRTFIQYPQVHRERRNVEIEG